MTRSLGQKWQTGLVLIGQSLSFQVTTSDEKLLQFDNVAPANWQFGQNFETKTNFFFRKFTSINASLLP
jgi:hypothetical protein